MTSHYMVLEACWDNARPLDTFPLLGFRNFTVTALGSCVKWSLDRYVYIVVMAALHLEAGPIRCVRGLKSSFVIGQKAEIDPNPFTPRGRVDLVV
jgi:hypothetical protein